VKSLVSKIQKLQVSKKLYFWDIYIYIYMCSPRIATSLLEFYLQLLLALIFAPIMHTYKWKNYKNLVKIIVDTSMTFILCKCKYPKNTIFIILEDWEPPKIIFQNSSWPKNSARIDLICTNLPSIDLNWCKNRRDLHKFRWNWHELVQKSIWLVHI